MIYKPKLFTQKAFADKLKCSPARVNQLIKEKNLPEYARAVKITGGVIIEIKNV